MSTSTATKLINDLTEKAENAKGDVISLIKADHKKVDALFKAYQEDGQKPADKMTLMQEIIKELNVHTAAEEKLVYPALKDSDEEGTNEAYEEHHSVEAILTELMTVKEINELVDAKVKVLSELVEHHVKEEEKTLLPEVKASGVDLNEMGSDFKAEKERLKTSSLKPGQANTNAKQFKNQK